MSHRCESPGFRETIMCKLNGKSGDSGMIQWRSSGVILARVTEICVTDFKWEIWRQRYVSAAFQGQEFSARTCNLLVN